MNGLKSNLTIGPSIGQGSFGEVFLAKDEVHGDVAVKVFRQDPLESPAECKRDESNC
jgi:serine/threonine protein kinase